MILGSGGREHALAWKIKQSPNCKKLFIAPGNDGTSQIAENIDLSINDHEEVKKALDNNSIDMLIIGPEEPLVNGIVDNIKSDDRFVDLLVIGPEKEAAQLEGSKNYAKEFMYEFGIPTAKAKLFTLENIEEGYKHLESTNAPFVLKADGLAGGKGVIITKNLNEAKKTLEELLIDKKFGASTDKVLIEQFLSGIELSVFILTDGNDFLLLPEAKDYKRLGDGDTGLNTGGMGAISPVPFAKGEFKNKVITRIIKPTLSGLKERGIKYNGFIFFGLINVDNDPYVIEYNVRLGDPETEALMLRIKSDMLDHLKATALKQLSSQKVEIIPYTSATVVLVSEGYPSDYENGKIITIDKNIKGVIPFHAGTKSENGKTITNGGRVIAVSSLGKNLIEATNKCYEAIPMIQWAGKTFRTDIGEDVRDFD